MVPSSESVTDAQTVPLASRADGLIAGGGSAKERERWPGIARRWPRR